MTEKVRLLPGGKYEVEGHPRHVGPSPGHLPAGRPPRSSSRLHLRRLEPRVDEQLNTDPVREQPCCEAQVGGMECGHPVERWGHQCEQHDPEGAARRAARNDGPGGDDV